MNIVYLTFHPVATNIIVVERCCCLLIVCNYSLTAVLVLFTLNVTCGTESTITEASSGLLYQPQIMMDGDECGAIGGMIGVGN
jgi:hypothetical protein